MNGLAAIPTYQVADPMMPEMALIKKVTWETDDTYTLLLDTSSIYGGTYKFKPGQFNMLYVFGRGESAISISSDCEKKNTLSHTIHLVGNVTTSMSRLQKGDYIGLRGPFGSSWPVDESKGHDLCIVAGGIGLAPLRPVIYYALRHRKEYGRILILYGARSPLDLLYRVELEKWSKQHDVIVVTTVDRGDSTWKGYIGVVTNLLSYVKLDVKQTIFMLCGPEIMMHYTLQDMFRHYVPEENVYVSLERNMKCAIGYCGHCQYGPKFICKDGPVFSYPEIKGLFNKVEL
jgi:NAD(P)H-flavin reductase